MMETSISKRPRLSLELTSFHYDIVAKLHQAEVTAESSSYKPHQRPGKKVMVQGEASHRGTACTPTSSSRVECKEIREFEDALQQELEWKKLEVAISFSRFTTAIPLPNKRIPCVVETSPEEEEDPKEEEDPEEEKEDPEEFPADFKRFHPPVFKGSTNALVVEDWIRDLEKTFTLIECTESQKVAYDMDSIQGVVSQEVLPYSKTGQENLSLVEYERKFDEFSRYAPHLMDTEECKTRHFEKGLRAELYNAIIVLHLPTYAEVL
ncbi:hypothetical protein FNV43_RR19040 [Rhamnella rubrinervis]|uniref:Retrotransposon gag domain-containing protein n=1 Tax=Rhamnella rubrinervis TaxID=2594499 RepID=A0A8K0GW60_9ROSA|nr:hypothetical protein FNV43_RR19040 [Rhamnella rubrinervis]